MTSEKEQAIVAQFGVAMENRVKEVKREHLLETISLTAKEKSQLIRLPQWKEGIVASVLTLTILRRGPIRTIYYIQRLQTLRQSFQNSSPFARAKTEIPFKEFERKILARELPVLRYAWWTVDVVLSMAMGMAVALSRADHREILNTLAQFPREPDSQVSDFLCPTIIEFVESSPELSSDISQYGADSHSTSEEYAAILELYRNCKERFEDPQFQMEEFQDDVYQQE